MEKIGVVLTKTVALRTVVSLIEDVKNMKWSPRKTPKTNRSLRFFCATLRVEDLRKNRSIIDNAAEAVTTRQNAIEKALISPRNLVKIAAVPKRTPATIPSVKASVLVLSDI